MIMYSDVWGAPLCCMRGSMTGSIGHCGVLRTVGPHVRNVPQRSENLRDAGPARRSLFVLTRCRQPKRSS